MKYFVLALLLALIAPAPLHAQSAYDKVYMEMVERAQTMPADFDFNTLRSTYIRTTFYDPFGEHAYKKTLFALLDKAKAGDAKAMADARMMAGQYFASYKIHSYMATSGLLTPEQTKFHEWALKGIARSMIGSDDASTPAKAIKVIDVGEEYFLVRSYLRGKSSGKQSTLQENGKIYDVIDYTDEAGVAKKAYFDVTIPFAKYPTSKDVKTPVQGAAP